MAKMLVAERIIEEVDEEGAGGMSRYALYAAAGAAALLAAWLITGNASKQAPAPETLSVRAAPISAMPASNIRQIDMSQTASVAPDADLTAAAASMATRNTAPAVPEAAALSNDAPLPPLPIRRPARPAVVAAAPTVERNVVVAEPEAPIYQTGAAPADLGVLHVEAPATYISPSVQPAPAPVVAAEPSGPVPPMPIDDAPAGAPVHHQGLLGVSERAAGTAWNWTTGAVGGVVNGVKEAF